MLRGVVFDFDGVIVDSHTAHKRAWRRLLESVGKRISEEELEFVVDGRKRDDILRHFLGELAPELIADYGRRKEQFFRDEAANVQTISGFRSFLRDLEDADVALGIASSGSRSRVNFLLSQLELTKHFQVIVTGDDVDRGKPDPAIFLRVAKDLQWQPSELLAFEDAVAGVRAAKAAGMRCVGVAQPACAGSLLAAGANPVVSDFQSLSHAKLEEIFWLTAC